MGGTQKNLLVRDALVATGLLLLMLVVGVWGLHWRWAELACFLTDVRTGLYTTLAALLGGLLGFVIAGVTILLTLGDGQRMNILRESAAFGQVFHIFTSTSRWLAGGTVLSLFALLLDRDQAPIPGLFLLLLWVVLIAVGRLYRSIWVLEKLIKIVVRDHQAKP